ncbi:MAG: carbonic anhydrase [bacterium]|nr:carbonic anhydrase [bacterium]
MTSKETLLSITPETAFQLFKEGNQRFSTGSIPKRNITSELSDSSKYPGPFAVVVACMDSRTSPELIMDQGLGDIFSIRVAANLIDDDVLGWIEYKD